MRANGSRECSVGDTGVRAHWIERFGYTWKSHVHASRQELESWQLDVIPTGLEKCMHVRGPQEVENAEQYSGQE
jgi:hypothetical protein